MVSYTLKAGGDARLHTEGWRRWSALHWRLEEMVSYTLKAGGDARLHTEGWRRCSATLKAGGDARLHTEGWRRCSATHWRLEEMLSYTLKARVDGQLHTEGWRRWSATHWRLEEMVSYTLATFTCTVVGSIGFYSFLLVNLNVMFTWTLYKTLHKYSFSLFAHNNYSPVSLL